MKTVSEAVERGFQPTPEEQDKILKLRAKRLAQETEGKESSSESVDVLEFFVSYERYGIEMVYIKEVCHLKQLTPLPCVPRFIVGIINVRGQIYSVIDIKKFFELQENGLSDLNKAIIVRSDDMELGILADNIIGVRSITLSNIQPPLHTMAGVRKEYLKGLAADGLAILDSEKILGDKKIVVYETV